MDQHLPNIKGEEHAEIMLQRWHIWDGYKEWLQNFGQSKDGLRGVEDSEPNGMAAM